MPEIVVKIEWDDPNRIFTAEHLEEYLHNYPSIDEPKFAVTELQQLSYNPKYYFMPTKQE